MKDEELFKAWKSEQYKDQSTEEKMEFVEHLHTFPKYFEKTFLAGLKAGRPQWHDLREDKNDLPKNNGDYWVYMNCCGNKITRALVWKNGVFCNMYDATIIAWCEITTFDKE